jgi:hypothetical protein
MRTKLIKYKTQSLEDYRFVQSACSWLASYDIFGADTRRVRLQFANGKNTGCHHSNQYAVAHRQHDTPLHRDSRTDRHTHPDGYIFAN